MPNDRARMTEQIQRMVAALVATQPAGAGLALIGGFRYRLLDRGARRSVDIDYHWEGDLAAKQAELVSLCSRRLLPQVRRQLALDGSVAPARSANHDFTTVATVDLAFWRLGSSLGRIEIPVDITRIDCLDPPTARTADGIVYRTPSNADMFDSKVIAVLGRTFIEHRDLIDLHLFASHAAPDAAQRIRGKLARLGLDKPTVQRRLDDVGHFAERHAASLEAVIGSQLDAAAAGVLRECGGGLAVLESVRGLLARLLGPGATAP